MPFIWKNVPWRGVLPTSSMSMVRMHFCTLVARGYGAGTRPVRYGMNGTMPATVNSSVGSSLTSEADGTTVWPRSPKKSSQRGEFLRSAWDPRGTRYCGPRALMVVLRTLREFGNALRRHPRRRHAVRLRARGSRRRRHWPNSRALASTSAKNCLPSGVLAT